MLTNSINSSQPPIKAVIIDLDGTMLDTVPDFCAAIDLMRAELNIGPFSREQVAVRVGKGTDHLVRSLLALHFDEAGVESCFGDALGAYRRHYLAINGRYCVPFDGVVEGLQAMKAQGLRLACVTNKPIAFTTPLLELKGLTGYFDVIYGGDSFARKKPDPMPLQQVMADFELAPHEVVAIGDSSNDAEAARAAGCFVLTVPYGYNHGRPIQEVDSDGIVTSLLEAATLISKHNRTHDNTAN